MVCKKCGVCCKHVALEIDKPTNKEDYNDILWYLLHEDVSVYIEDGEWHIEFTSKCKALGDDNKCNFYEDRPKICRSYSSCSCVNNGEGEPHDIKFDSADDFLKYMKEKGIDYKYKSWKNK